MNKRPWGREFGGGRRQLLALKQRGENGGGERSCVGAGHEATGIGLVVVDLGGWR
jgi:hypothetical protein